MPYSHFSPTGKNDGNRKDAAFDKLTYLCLTQKSRVLGRLSRHCRQMAQSTPTIPEIEGPS